MRVQSQFRSSRLSPCLPWNCSDVCLQCPESSGWCTEEHESWQNGSGVPGRPQSLCSSSERHVWGRETCSVVSATAPDGVDSQKDTYFKRSAGTLLSLLLKDVTVSVRLAALWFNNRTHLIRTNSCDLKLKIWNFTLKLKYQTTRFWWSVWSKTF